MAGRTRNIVFKFDGANVSTQAFGREFISLMANVYALVQACSDEEVRIVSIENNCIKFTLAATTLAASVLCVGGMDGVRDAVKYNAAAKAISATLKKHCATLEFSDSASGEVCFFDGQREMPSVPEIHHDIKTTLAVYGELLDVGGVNPNAHIQSDAFEDDVVLDVEREDAKKLAQWLYSQIGVNASVTIRDGHVIAGKVLNVIDYAPEDMGEWLGRNKNALGLEAFKDIDVSEFIAEQRI